MKTLITLIAVSLAICSFGEKEKSQSFSSLPECKQHARELIGQFNTKSINEIYSLLGVPIEEESDMEFMLSWIDRMKANAGEFKYIDEIGTASLGTFLTKVGYIIKFESGTFFGEVTIGKVSDTEFKIVKFNVVGKNDANELIDEIPDYYWK